MLLFVRMSAFVLFFPFFHILKFAFVINFSFAFIYNFVFPMAKINSNDGYMNYLVLKCLARHFWTLCWYNFVSYICSLATCRRANRLCYGLNYGKCYRSAKWYKYAYYFKYIRYIALILFTFGLSSCCDNVFKFA